MSIEGSGLFRRLQTGQANFFLEEFIPILKSDSHVCITETMKVSLYAQTACTIMVLRWPGARLKAASPSAATMMTKLLLESAVSHGLLTEYLTLLVHDDHRIMLPDTTNVEVIFLRTFLWDPF